MSTSSVNHVKEFLQPAAQLVLECLGELGAVDPTRVSVRSQPKSAPRLLGPGRESGWVTDEELCARLLERFLVKTLRGANEGQVPPAAYTCTVLLQDICKCTSETPYHLESLLDVVQHDKQAKRAQDDMDVFRQLGLRTDQGRAAKFWSSLPESTRHTMKPFLQLRAVLPPKAKDEQDSEVIFCRGIRYGDWLARWSRQLQQRATMLKADGRLDLQQQQRAQLLLACEPCLDFDQQMALHVGVVHLHLRAQPLTWR